MAEALFIISVVCGAGSLVCFLWLIFEVNRDARHGDVPWEDE